MTGRAGAREYMNFHRPVVLHGHPAACGRRGHDVGVVADVVARLYGVHGEPGLVAEEGGCEGGGRAGKPGDGAVVR